MIRRSICLVFALALTLLGGPAFAQSSDDDVALKPAEPDYTIVNLPTSLRLPVMKDEIRITHRFVRPLKCDSCPNSLLADAFGIDVGADIGLEWRMGIIPSGQIVVHRANDKTIEFMGEYSLTRQSGSMPLEIAALAAVQGAKNFTTVYSPSVGLVLTRLFGDGGAIHVDPIWTHNTNKFFNVHPDPNVTETDKDTLMVGVGARVRVGKTLYLTGEATPRVSGFRPGKTVAAFAIEKRMGGHMFQLNFANANQTMTFGQLAEGTARALSPSGKAQWYMGFNITRKFF